MKKGLFLTMAVFAITLFYSQIASGQMYIVCNNTEISRSIYNNAPYFEVDLYVQVNTTGAAEAGVTVNNRYTFVRCTIPGCKAHKYLRLQNRNGYLEAYCSAEGDASAKLEIWW